LLRAAARIAPADLVVDVDLPRDERNIPFELPTFGRATSMWLGIGPSLNFTLPPAGKFDSLERLSPVMRRGRRRTGLPLPAPALSPHVWEVGNLGTSTDAVAYRHCRSRAEHFASGDGDGAERRCASGSSPALPGRWGGPSQRPPRGAAPRGARPLRSALEAARTSVLSSLWHGLWTELRDLNFDSVDPDALDAALAQVHPELNRLNIHISGDYELAAARISSTLCAANRLAPSKLCVALSRHYCNDEFPCFQRTTSIDLSSCNPRFRLVPCELKKFLLATSEPCEFIVSLSAPRLEDFRLEYSCEHSLVGSGDKWRLHQLKMVKGWRHVVGRLHMASYLLCLVVDRAVGDGDGEDRISGLPVELRLEVLARLGCAREAARTSVLSSLWRGLWTELRDLSFDGFDPDSLDAALAQVRPELNHLYVLVPHGYELVSDEATSLLGAMDRLRPLVVALGNKYRRDDDEVEFPCFQRATAIKLYSWNIRLAVPPTGDFASLEQLRIITTHDFVYSRVGSGHNWRLWRSHWDWRCLEPPPFVSDAGNKATHIGAYTVVGGSDILMPTPGIGTYSFDTASGSWSKAGDWELPFYGRADFFLEFGAWLGFSAEDNRLCYSSDLGASMQRQPALDMVWDDPTPQMVWGDQNYEYPQKYTGILKSELVHLGSGKFCVARLFESETSQTMHLQSALQADQSRGRALQLGSGSGSGRRLGSPPAPQGRVRSTEDADGDAVNRIGSLPDDVRLVVLVRLRSAREAARTSILSREWRDAGLWTRLPELWFDGVDLDSLERALAQVTRRDLDRLVVRLKGWVPPERASSLLHAAQRLAPEKLDINGGLVLLWFGGPPLHPIELPCLERTAILKLAIAGLHCTPPTSGEFKALQILCLDSVEIDTGGLLPLCPCLRVLDMRGVYISGTVAVHSAALEMLVVKGSQEIRRIDIVAPKLHLVDLKVDIGQEFSVSFSAPLIEEIVWECTNLHMNVGSREMRRLMSISQYSQGVRGIRYVSLQLQCGGVGDVERTFEQEIAQLPVPNFAALDLCFMTVGHFIGPLVLHLIQIRPALQFLKISYKFDHDYEGVRGSCYDYCPCQQPNDWGSQSIALTGLLEVDFVGFQGEDHEFDLLRILFRCAALLQILILRVCANISPRSSGYMKICSIFKKYPHVSCYVYRIGSEEVLYP
ncbi:hypothetical protein BAE44_0014056, partial [Dichanthelium oligosanthes]